MTKEPREVEWSTDDGQSPAGKAQPVNPLYSNGSTAPAGQSAPVLPESLAHFDTDGDGIVDSQDGWDVASTQWVGGLVEHVGVPKENERDRRRRINLELLDQSNMISPESSFRKKWDMAQVFLLAYVAASVPYRLGFDDDVELWSFPWFWVDLCVDIYFVADIFVSLRTAFYDTRGDLVVGKDEIHTQYIRRSPYWFWIDMLACFPGSYIEWAMAANGTESEGGGRANKMLRMLRLLRLLKLLRLLRLNRLMARYQEEMFHIMTTMKLGKIIVIMLIIGHWLACCWYWAGRSENFDEICSEDDNGDPKLCVGWVDRRFGDGASKRFLNTTGGNASSWERYSAAFYWSVMTMTTVGYGDIIPETGLEVIMAIAGMMTGGFIFGMIVGNLAELSKSSNAGELMKEKSLSKIDSIINCGTAGGVPRDLQRRVRSYFSFYYQQRSSLDLSKYIMQLPSDLRDDLAAQMQWIDNENEANSVFGVLHKIPFFVGLDSTSLIHICAKMNVMLQQPLTTVAMDNGDTFSTPYIMQQGEVGTEMYIILTGDSVNVEVDGKQVGRLMSGDFCGELAALFKPGTFADADGKPVAGHRRTRTVYAAKDEVVLGVLTFDDLQELRRARPQISEKLVPYANAIRETLREPLREEAKAATPLDCHPELEMLESAIMKRMDEQDERLARIEALLVKGS